MYRFVAVRAKTCETINDTVDADHRVIGFLVYPGFKLSATSDTIEIRPLPQLGGGLLEEMKEWNLKGFSKKTWSPSQWMYPS